MILKSGILLLTVLGAVQSYQFNSQPTFGYNQQAPQFSSHYQLFTAPASSSITAFEASPSQINNIAQRLFYQQQFNQLPLANNRYIQSPQRSFTQIPSRQQQVPNAFHMSTSQVYEPLNQQQQQQQQQQVQQPAQYSSPIVRSAAAEQKQSRVVNQAEKDFLSSLQVIDTQGRVRDLRDFGIGGSGNEASEPELERQLLSIFHTINKDLANAQFLPLDMNGAQQQIDNMLQSQYANRQVSQTNQQNQAPRAQPHLNQQRVYENSQNRKPLIDEQASKKQHFQILRPARGQQQQHQLLSNKVEQQPLRSPAQTLRATDKKAPVAAVREEQKVILHQEEVASPFRQLQQQQQQTPIEQNLAQKQVDESNKEQAKQTVSSIKAPAQLLREQELKVRLQEENEEQVRQQQLNSQLNSRKQESRGQYTAPVEQQRQPSIRAPADFERKPVQVQVPIEQQQQQQLGFDDESIVQQKQNTQLLLPAVKEPSFTRQAQIGGVSRQSRIEQRQQQQPVERVIPEQVPIVQEAEQQKLQNFELNNNRQQIEHNYEENRFAPASTNNKQNQQNSLGWTPIVPSTQQDVVIEQQREQTEPQMIINQQTIQELPQIPLEQKPIVQLKETLEEEKANVNQLRLEQGFQEPQQQQQQQQQQIQEEQQQQKIDIKQEDDLQLEVKPLIRQQTSPRGVRISKLKKPIQKLNSQLNLAKLNDANKKSQAQANQFSQEQQQQELLGQNNQDSFGTELEQQKHEEIPFQQSELQQQQKQEEALSAILAQQRQDMIQQQQQQQQDLDNVNVQPQQPAQVSAEFNEQQTSSTSLTSTTTPATIFSTTSLTTTTSSAPQPTQRTELEKGRKIKLQLNGKSRQNPVQKMRDQQAQLARQQQQQQQFQEQKQEQQNISPNPEPKRPRRVQQFPKQQQLSQQRQKQIEQPIQEQSDVSTEADVRETSKPLPIPKETAKKIPLKLSGNKRQRQQQTVKIEPQQSIAAIAPVQQVENNEQKVQQELNQQQEIQQPEANPIQVQVQTDIQTQTEQSSDEISQVKEDLTNQRQEPQQAEQTPLNEQANQQISIQQNEDLSLQQRDETQVDQKEDIPQQKEDFTQQKEDSSQQLSDSQAQREEIPVLQEQEQQQQQDNLAQEIPSRSTAETSTQQESFTQVNEETSTARQDVSSQQNLEISPAQQQEEQNQQIKDSSQELRPESVTQRELQQLQQQETTTEANSQRQQEFNSQQPDTAQTNQEQKQEQNGQQEQEKRDGEVQTKLSDNFSETQTVSQERQQISTTTSESLSQEIKINEELIATTTARPPTRTARPNPKRDQSRLGLKQRGFGRQDSTQEVKILTPRQGGKASKGNSQIAPQKRDLPKNRSSTQEEQRIKNDESSFRKPSTGRLGSVQNYMSASQLLNTYNPLQFEPERISSLNRVTESSSQTTNVNPSPSGDSY